MRKMRKFIPKMRNAIPKGYVSPFRHVNLVGTMSKTWGGCDKASSVGNFAGGGGS